MAGDSKIDVTPITIILTQTHTHTCISLSVSIKGHDSSPSVLFHAHIWSVGDSVPIGVKQNCDENYWAVFLCYIAETLQVYSRDIAQFSEQHKSNEEIGSSIPSPFHRVTNFLHRWQKAALIATQHTPNLVFFIFRESKIAI